MKENQPRRGVFFTVMCDILFQLFVFFLAWAAWLKIELVDSVELAGLVPGLLETIKTKEVENGGLRGIVDQQGRKIGQMGNTIEGLQGNVQQLSGAIQGKDQTIVGLHSTISQLGNQIGERDQTIKGLHTKVTDLGDEIGEYRAKLRSGDPVTVIVLIDVSGSMAEPIEALRTSMAALFEFMPNTSRDFRVGILAFRQGVVARYPVTQIQPLYEDGGQSQVSVLKFLDTLEAANGYTDHLPVFREAVSMLVAAHPTADPDLKERVIFVGDVGPSELDRTPGYTDVERETKERILAGMKKWASVRNRAIVSLYAMSNYTRDDPGAAESRKWFETLGSVSKTSAFYTDSNQLLRAILRASID